MPWPLPPCPATLLCLPDLATLAGLVGFSPSSLWSRNQIQVVSSPGVPERSPQGGGRSRVVNRGQPRVRLQVQFQTVPDATGSCEGTVPRRVSSLDSSMPVSGGAPAGHSLQALLAPHTGEAPPASRRGRKVSSWQRTTQRDGCPRTRAELAPTAFYTPASLRLQS